jgi:hypothetical protein
MSDASRGRGTGAQGAGPDESAALADLRALAPAADRARLAGIAAARPLMAARATQLAREAYRAQTLFGADDPRAQELALKSARQAVRVARVDTEFTRAQVSTPAPNPDATVIWGRVSEDGKPKAGVTVSARGAKGEVQGFDCTDAVGGFTMTVPTRSTVQLRVNDANDAVLYAGTEHIATAPGAVFYRDIRIGETPIDICRRPADDPDGGKPDTVRVPDIVGRSEADGVRLLTAVGLRPGERTEVQSTEPAGQILRQMPEANAEVAPGSAVAIQVAVRNDRVVPRLVGLGPADARAALEKSGLSVAGMDFRLDPRRPGIVLQQDPQEGTRVDPSHGVKLVIGLPQKPVPPPLVLDLVALDARFKTVRMTGEPLSARAAQLGLRNRRALAEFAGAADAQVRDAIGLPALRDAQTVKRILRDTLAKTE